MKHLINFFLTTITIIIIIFTIIYSIITFPFKIILSWFGISFPSPKHPHTTGDDIITLSNNGSIGNINYDSLTEKEQQVIQKKAAQGANIPIYDGKVEHAYELTYVKEPTICPRCQSHTQQCYAHFIYTTQDSTRYIFAPSGFFCSECPTVIIDQEMLKTGIPKEFEFRGVFGIICDTRDKPDLFMTWNGKKSLYVVDEEKNTVELITSDNIVFDSQRLKRKKNPRRKKIVKQSRRKNRRKK